MNMDTSLTPTQPHACVHLIPLSLDQGYNDNSGLAPILANYLQSESDEGQVLVLVINQLGDNQMETYFNNPSGSNNGGMLCEDERRCV